MGAGPVDQDAAPEARDRTQLGDEETGIRAILFDFGGVLTVGPFEAFARYEDRNGLPSGLIRSLNARDPHENAWARLERSEVTLAEFVHLFEAEALAAGHRVDATEILSLLSGELRHEMVEAVRRLRPGYVLGLLTNNFVPAGEGGDRSGSPTGRAGVVAEVLELFDEVVESSRIGVRKPEPAFFEIACDRLGIEPAEAVFLDDLGVNLKPARAMGMRTIKVESAAQALSELEETLGISLR